MDEAAAAAAAAGGAALAQAGAKGPGSVWLDAWHDSVAGVRATQACVCSADVFSDTDYRLVAADHTSNTLKIWKGTDLELQVGLLASPTAITAFYPEARNACIAVACGSIIYIFKRAKPFCKFTLPPIDINANEEEVWSQASSGRLSAAQTAEALQKIREKGVGLTWRSSDLLALEDSEARAQLFDSVRSEPLVQTTCVTCMDSIKKSLEDPDAVSCVVFGTESSHVMILDPAATTVIHKIKLPAVPVFMSAAGTLDVEYRIVVACRDAKVYTIKNGEVSSLVIQPEAQICGLVRTAKAVVVGCINSAMHSYHLKGKKQYSVYFPAPILCMELLSVQRQRMVKAVVVALANGQVRVHSEANKHLLSLHYCPDPVMALRFGRVGREDHTLVTTTASGHLVLKILPRNAQLEGASSGSGPPVEQDVPLDVPKKTRLAVEQAKRETDQPAEMHRAFQRDLCKLRLMTARAYYKVLTDGQGPVSHASNASVRLNAQVLGLGPLFKLKLQFQNTGARAVTNLRLVVHYDQAVYQCPQPHVQVPLLVPGRLYYLEVEVHSVDPNGAADSLRVILFNPASSSGSPVLSALIKMPMSEPPLDGL